MTATSTFRKAERSQARARVAIDGPAKSGKSVTGLRLAMALARSINADAPRVACVDTEFGSLSKYAGDEYDDGKLSFDVMELRNFSPDNYIAAIRDAERGKYDALFIDSLSHAWIGEGGILDQKDKSSERNSFTAWAKLTPQQRKLVDTILASPLHFVGTMRSKMEYELVDRVNEKTGRTTKEPVKVGLAPIQREGMEYEFDLLVSIDQDHVAKVTGSRCRAMDRATATTPGSAFFAPYIEWLKVGSPIAPIIRIEPEQINRIKGMLSPANRDRYLRWAKTEFRIDDWPDLTKEQADQAERYISEKVSANGTYVKAEQQPVTVPATASANGTGSVQVAATRGPDKEEPSDEQIAKIADLRGRLFEKLVITDEKEQAGMWSDILGRRGVKSAYALSPVQANELIGKLAALVNADNELDARLETPDPKTVAASPSLST